MVDDDRWAAVQRIAGELEEIRSGISCGRASIGDTRAGIMGKFMSIQILTGDAQRPLRDTIASWVMQEWAASVRQGDGLHEEWRALLQDLREHPEFA